MSSKRSENLSKRCGSSRNRSRIWSGAISAWWAWRAFQAGKAVGFVMRSSLASGVGRGYHPGYDLGNEVRQAFLPDSASGWKACGHTRRDAYLSRTHRVSSSRWRSRRSARCFASGGSDGRVIVWDTLTGGMSPRDQMDGENIGAVAFSPGRRASRGREPRGQRPRLRFGRRTAISVLRWDEQGRVTAPRLRAGRQVARLEQLRRLVRPLFRIRRDLRRSGPAARSVRPTVHPPHLAGRPDRRRRRHGAGHPPPRPRLSRRSRSASPTATGRASGASPSAPTAGRSPPRSRAACSSGTWPTRRLLDQWKDHDDVTTGVAISPDGSRLLTCSWDRTARVYEFDPAVPQAGALVGCYDWRVGRLFDVAISPDSTLAVAGGDEGDYVVAWDIE